MEVAEDGAGVWRGSTGVAGRLLHPAEGGIEQVGMHFERIRCGPSRHAAQVRSKVISQRDQQTLVAANTNRRPGARAVETVQRGGSIPGGRPPRWMRVADNVEREGLIGPLGRTPYPWLGPVFDPHAGEIGNA